MSRQKNKGAKRGKGCILAAIIIILGVFLCRNNLMEARAAEDNNNYLSFQAEGGDVSIGVKMSGEPERLHWQYSFDKENWADMVIAGNIDQFATIRDGQTCYLRTAEKRTAISCEDSYWSFTMMSTNENAVVLAKGNTMSLLDPELKAVRVEEYGFAHLFENCLLLKTAPELPAVEISKACYLSMFNGCRNLTDAPQLPAMTIYERCYAGMFKNCVSLTKAPELPAKEMALSCYNSMFYQCTALTKAPELPATVLAERCYYMMFVGCENLINAPSELPALKMDVYSCFYMFALCSNLVQAPKLPATELANNCYRGMFSTCEKLEAAPVLPAKVLVDGCYDDMFYKCSKIREVTALFTEGAADGLSSTWLEETAQNGVLYCSPYLNTSEEVYLPETWQQKRNASYIAYDLAGGRNSSENPSFYTMDDEVIFRDASKEGYRFCGWLNQDTDEYCTKINRGSIGDRKLKAVWEPIRYYIRLDGNGADTGNMNSYAAGIRVYGEEVTLPVCSYAKSQYCFAGWNTKKDGSGTLYKDCGKIQSLTTEDGAIVTLYAQWKRDETTVDFLSFTAVNGDVTIGMLKAGNPEDLDWQYSFDKKTWVDVTLTKTADIVEIASGKTCYLRSKEARSSISKDGFNYWNFTMTAKSTLASVEAGGNIMSLLDPLCETDAVGEYGFIHLFGYCVMLKTAPKLMAMEISNRCYKSMFENCNGLVEAPELPATILADSCYESMFQGCNRLNAAPKLPATALADSCYKYMFSSCSSLTKAPELPATTLADSCYNCMFAGCIGLTATPELPATTLAQFCYYHMFTHCSNLTTSADLPATTLAVSCYDGMFYECNSLTKAPSLPATKLADSCYFNMFYNCNKMTKAPKLPATTLKNSCYGNMFKNCLGLVDAPELPATKLAEGCYDSMFSSCTSLTTAPKLPATTLTYSCYDSMFADCTGMISAPELPAMNLASGCYGSMFLGCSKLTKAPELPATKLASECYKSMFRACYSLTEAPQLPATTLENSCYDSMFYDCSRLVKAPELPATVLADGCYRSMFYDCTRLTSSPMLPAKELKQSCYYMMFRYCTSLQSVQAAFIDCSAQYSLGFWLENTFAAGTLYCPENPETSSLNLPAGWTRKSLDIPVTYNLNGGTNDAKNPAAHRLFGNTVTLSSPTRKGYSFKGWYLESGFKNKVTELADGLGTAITLYAKWQAKTYSILFDANGGTGIMDAISSVAYDKTVALPAGTFTLKGYHLDGWNTKADGSGKTYADGSSVKNLSATSGAKVTLYAQWAPNIYTIKFDGNGATSGTMALMENCLYGTGYTLTANAFKRTGYQLDSWNTKADGSGTKYANKASVKNVTATNGKTVTLFAQWKLTEYKITYELNGGTNAASNPTVYNKASEEITFASPTRTGYTFKGWYKEETFTTKATKLSTGSTGNKIFYAKWAPNLYTIAFDGNGAVSGEMADLPNREYDKTYTLRTNAFKKTGYTFAGWNTKASGSGTAYEKNASVTNLSAKNGAVVTLYAQWIPNTYSIKFSGNGSDSGSVKTMTGCEYDKSYVLNVNGFRKVGYTFLGWNVKADGTGKSYTNAQSVKNLTASAGGSVTLYAQWRLNTYNIMFDGNGCDSGSMNVMNNRVYGNTYTLPINAFKKTGYSFDGWNTRADGSGTAIENRQSIQNLTEADGETVILYAQWKARTYSIAFDGNGAGSGSMGAMTVCVYDNQYTLTANSFKRTGYTFGGWNTKADGSGTKYANKETVSNLANTEGKIVTLYAQWKAVSYQLIYELNGGTNSAANPASYQITSDIITLEAPTKDGCTFKGWYKDSAFTTKVTKINTGSTGDRTLYALWAPNTYTVAFDGNGATSGEMNPLTKRECGQTYTLRTNAFDRTGYTFKNWNTKADGSGTSYKNKAEFMNLSTVNGDIVTLYAQWKAVDYTITYQLYGGTNAAENPASYRITSSTITLAEPTRVGYKFVGWYQGSTKVTKITKGSTGDITLYANWEPINYYINLDGNGASSGDMSGFALGSKNYGVMYQLPEVNYLKKGYSFIGWNTKKDGSGINYKDGEYVKNLTTTDGATVTLYAQWEKK